MKVVLSCFSHISLLAYQNSYLKSYCLYLTLFCYTFLPVSSVHNYVFKCFGFVCCGQFTSVEVLTWHHCLLARSATVTDQPISLAEWWYGLAYVSNLNLYLQEDIAERCCLFFNSLYEEVQGMWIIIIEASLKWFYLDCTLLILLKESLWIATNRTWQPSVSLLLSGCFYTFNRHHKDH